MVFIGYELPKLAKFVKIFHFKIHSIHFHEMKPGKFVKESDLAALAKEIRQAAGKSKADVARELGVKEPSVFRAEEEPEKSLTKLRSRMIETYSKLKVSGPYFRIDREP